MEEFKIVLGAELKADASSDINAQIKSLHTEPIKLKLDTDSAKSKLKTIKKQIESLNDIKVALNTGTAGSKSGNKNLLPISPVDVSKLTQSLDKLDSSLESIRMALGSLDDSSGMQSILTTINQVNSSLSEMSKQFKTVEQMFNGASFNLNFNLGMSGGKNPIANNALYSDKAKTEVIPQLRKQAEQLAEVVSQHYGQADKYAGAMQLLFQTQSQLKGKIDVLDLFNRVNDSDASLNKQMSALRQFINVLQEAAAIRGIDLSSVTSGFSKTADELVSDTQKILSGENQMEESMQKLQNIFGSTNNINLDGVATQLDSIINKLEELNQTAKQFSGSISFDGLKKSVDDLLASISQMSSTFERLSEQFKSLNIVMSNDGTDKIKENSDSATATVVQNENKKQQAIQQTQRLISDSAQKSIENIGSKEIGRYFKIDKSNSDAFEKEMNNLVKQWTDNKGNLVDLRIDTRTSYDKDAQMNIERLHQAQVTYNNELGETIKKTIAWRKIGSEVGSDGKKKPIYGWAEVAGQYSKTLGQTSTQTDRFVKQQKTAVANLTNQINQMNRAAIDQNAAKPIKDTSHLDALANKYDEIKNAIQRMEAASSDTFVDEQNNVKRLIAEFKSLVSEYKNAENVSTKMKGTDFASGLEIAKNDLEKLKAEAKGFAVDFSKLDIDGVVDASSLNKFNDQLKITRAELAKIKAEASAANADQKLEIGRMSLSSNIDVWLKKNTAAANQFGERLRIIKAQIEGCDATTLDRLEAEFKQVKQEATLAGKAGLSLGDKLKKQFSQYSSYFSVASMFSYAEQAIRSMYDNVVEVDTAMTDLKKVTDETDASYQNFLNNASQKSQSLGRSLSSFIQQSANWAKMGFDTSESSILAEISSIYANVADVDDATAVSDIVTAMKAFNIEAANAISIIDPINKISNEFAVTAAGLGQGLSRAASTMATSGTDLEHTLALLTGISEITQSPEEAGNFLKTAVARIQGMKGELEELGEEVDESVDSISKVQTQILNLTKNTSKPVNIFDDNGEFRDYYEIMQDIASIVDELKSTERAQLYEILFGKNRMNQGAAMIQAFQSGRIGEALDAALDSDGSAYAEQEKWLESLEAKLGRLEAAWESLSASFLKSDFLGGLIEGLTGFVNLLDGAINTLGTIPTLLTALSSGMSLFKNKGLFTFDKDANHISLLNVDLTKLVDNYNKVTTACNVYNSNLNKSTGLQNAYIQAVNGQNSSLGKYLSGLNGAKASMGGYIASLVGAKVASVALQVATVALNAAITMGISILISDLVSAINSWINAEEELAEKVDEVTSKYNEQKNTLQNSKSTFDELSSKYKKLSKGVSDFGENISLTEKEFSEYNSVTNQIADMFPNLIQGYNDVGTAILTCKGNVDLLTQAYNNQLIAANNIILSDGENVFTNFKNQQTEFEKTNSKKNKFTVYTKRALESILNSNDLDTAINEYAKTGSVNMVSIVKALKDAGLKQGTWETGHDFIKRSIQENKVIVEAIVGDFNKKMEEEAKKLRSLSEAYVENALLSTDYSDMRMSMQNVITNIVSQMDYDFLSQFDTLQDLYDYLGNMLNSFKEADDNVGQSIELYLDVKTRFNDNQCTVSDYIQSVNNIKTAILGLGENTQKSIMISLGLDDDNIESQYNKLISKLVNAGVTKDVATNFANSLTMSDLSTSLSLWDSAGGMYGYTIEKLMSLLNDYKNLTKDIEPFSFEALMAEEDTDSVKSFKTQVDEYLEQTERLKEALESIASGEFTTKDRFELESLFPQLVGSDNLEQDIKSLIDELTGYKKTVNKTTGEVKEATGIMKVFEDAFGRIDSEEDREQLEAFMKTVLELGQVVGSTAFSIDIDVEADNMKNLYDAINESVSGTGLSTESIKNIENMYSDLEGYDPSKLFELTEHGVHMNVQELRKLQSEYESLNKLKVKDELQKLKQEYNNLDHEVKNFKGTEEELQQKMAERDAIANRITDVQQLMAQYEGLTSAYNKWIEAQSTGDENDMYLNLSDSIKSAKELYKQGWIGTDDFRSWVQMMTDEDLSTASIEKILSVYEKGMPAMERFFTGNTDGLLNFLNDAKYVSEQLGEEFVTLGEDGTWKIDFEGIGDEEFAKAFSEITGLQISAEQLQIILRALSAAGFDVNLESAYASVEELQSKVEETEAAVKKLGAEPVDIDIYCDVESLDTEIDKAKTTIEELRNSDLTLEVNAAKLADAEAKLDVLVQRKVELNQPAFMSIDVSQVDTELQDALTLLQNYQTAVNNLKALEIKGADTSEIEAAQKKVDDYAAAVNSLPTDVKTKVGITTDNVNAESLDKLIADETITIPVTADTTQASTDIEGLSESATITMEAQLGDSFDNVGQYVAALNNHVSTITIDAKLGDGFDTAGRMVSGISQTTATMTIDAELGDGFDTAGRMVQGINNTVATMTADVELEDGFDKVGAYVAAINNTTAIMTADVELGDGFDTAGRMVQGINETTATMTVDAELGEGFDAAGRMTQGINDTTATMTIEADLGDSFDAAGRMVQGINETTATMTIDAELGDGFDTAGRMVSGISQTTATMTVDAKLGEGFTTAGRTVQGINETTATVTIDADDEAIQNYEPPEKEAEVKYSVNEEEVDEFIEEDHETTGNVTWDNIITKVTEWANKIKESLGVVRWGNNTSKVRTHFSATGTVNWQNSGGGANVNGTAHANGTAYARGDWGTKDSGTALGGELGQELIVRDGHFFTIGDNGAEFFEYKKGDIIFNAEQTKQILEKGKITSGEKRGRAFASGTAFAPGSSASGQIIVNGQVTTTPSKGSGKGGSGDDSDKDEKEFKETFDWIEVAIDRIERAISRLDLKANSIYKSWSSRNKNLKKEISKISEEIDLQARGYQRYLDQANAVGLDESWAEKVRNGEIDISTITDEDLAEKINEYSEWYNKAIDCKDAIDELNESLAECYKLAFDNVVAQYDNILAIVGHERNMLEELIAQSEAKGHITSAKYYKALMKTESENIQQLEKEKAALIAALEAALASGTIEKGSQAWYRNMPLYLVTDGGILFNC